MDDNIDIIDIIDTIVDEKVPHLVLVLEGPARDVDPTLAASSVQPVHNMEMM